MRISDWSSDVCSSDLSCCRWPSQFPVEPFFQGIVEIGGTVAATFVVKLRIAGELHRAAVGQAKIVTRRGQIGVPYQHALMRLRVEEIGSASGRERVCM